MLSSTTTDDDDDEDDLAPVWQMICWRYFNPLKAGSTSWGEMWRHHVFL
jgi:hypothetical protein